MHRVIPAKTSYTYSLYLETGGFASAAWPLSSYFAVPISCLNRGSSLMSRHHQCVDRANPAR